MPISTDLSVSPYFDDFDVNKDFYKVLFRPGVAVQTRELNQLQSILQNQIERFGDHVFKRGTIIDGCDITYQSAMQYVKIKDNQVDGAPVNVNQFTGYYVKDTADLSPLVASVQTVIDGFESTSPNLKTLYVRYINSGYANVGSVRTERQQFLANDTLTVYKPSNPIEVINVSNASAGFSNSDSVVIVSAIAVQNTTNGTTLAGFNTTYLTNGTGAGLGANVQIVAVDTTSNTEAVILRVKPFAVDLKSGNTAKWTFALDQEVQANVSGTASDAAKIVGFVGTGAAAVMRTIAGGAVSSITVTQNGSGYYVLPTVSIQSPNATTTQIDNANLVSQTYLTTIKIANSDFSPVGSSFGVTVGKGVIFQKGYFSRVNEHMVIVEKYSNTGFNKAVGFDTTETIINSNQDTSLLDNATGEPNATAPGANRLKLTPTLVVKTKAEADANTDFFSVVEFSEGNPYKQNQQTQYNILGKEFARRTFEESGNYVIDPFILNTIPTTSIASEETSFRISIDPGVGYIRGNRVETVQSYITTVDKGRDTFVANNANVSLNYGNYIRVNELSGVFKFSIGALVSLYGTAGDFISGGLAGTVPTTGSLGILLGTARMRSLVLESGVPGTSTASYRLYLFDIQLATARNFKLVRSIFYDGTYKGVADAILEGGQAVLKDNNLSSLLYYAGRPAVKSGNNYSYVYRTVNDTGDLKLITAGTITLSATGTETFPYTAGATLSPAQEQDIIIAPLANAQFAANASGSVSSNATSTQVNGTSTAFTTQFEAGDYIKIANSTTSIVRQVAAVANDTVLQLTTNGSAYTGANLVSYFPQFVPISLRAGRSANVDAEANTIVINLGAAVSAETSVAVSYNVRSSNTTPVTKSVNRDNYIRLQLSNNAPTYAAGPWALGVPDIFHLKGVYLGSNNSFGPSDAGVTDITNQFYIDHNQTENYYGMSYLYRKTDANTAITTSNFLLVKFDHFTNSGEGLKAPGSVGTYPVNDGITLASSTSSINTLEIPEVFGTKGDYYDLRDQFDFRPVSVANATPNATPASAPINPAEKASADKFGTSDKRFPAPDSNLTGIIAYWQGRTDRVTIDQKGNFNIMRGSPESTQPPEEPNDSLTINILQIPPYPSHPKRISASSLAFRDKKIANENYSNRRFDQYCVIAPVNPAQRAVLQPRGYTMVDIGSLERRIESLEYYTTFTLVELLTQSTVIPSSANNTIDRVKFGFFVDGFNDYKYAETSNPQYNASIVDGFLGPKVEEINLPLVPVGGGVTTTLPYFEKVFIAQPGATNGPVVVAANTVANTAANTAANTVANTDTVIVVFDPEPAANNTTTTPPVDPITGTITITPVQPTETAYVTKTLSITQSQKNQNNSDTGAFYDEFFYTFSASTGAAEFYINSKDNNIGVIVFQSTTPNGPWTTQTRNSGTHAQAITSTDVATKALSGLNNGKKIEHQGSLDTKGYYFTGTSPWREDQLKLLWTHNPASGQYYMIRVYKGKHHSGFLGGGGGNAGAYGFKLYYPADVIETTTTNVNGFSPTLGTDLSSYLGTYNWEYGINWAQPLYSNYYQYNPTTTTDTVVDPGAISNEQAFLVNITGLRPDTAHKFFLEGIDETANCKQEGTILGAGLTSDSNGNLEFTFYYYPTIQTINVITETAAVTEMVASTKAAKIVNTDNTSKAESTIQVKSYIKKLFTAPPVATVNYPTLTTNGGTIDNGPGAWGAGGRNFQSDEHYHEL